MHLHGFKYIERYPNSLSTSTRHTHWEIFLLLTFLLWSSFHLEPDHSSPYVNGNHQLSLFPPTPFLPVSPEGQPEAAEAEEESEGAPRTILLTPTKRLSGDDFWRSRLSGRRPTEQLAPPETPEGALPSLVRAEEAFPRVGVGVISVWTVDPGTSGGAEGGG